MSAPPARHKREMSAKAARKMSRNSKKKYNINKLAEDKNFLPKTALNLSSRRLSRRSQAEHLG
jgi:hypothetical protein